MKLKTLITRKYILIAVLAVMLQIFSQKSSTGQTPPPPPPPENGTNNGHGLGGNQGAPGAPVGSGLELLLIMAAAYAARRYFPENKKDDQR